jgi:hypothetical protein
MEVKKDMTKATRGGSQSQVSTPDTGKYQKKVLTDAFSSAELEA